MADREPHHAHLAEMRADRVVAELRAMAAIAAVPCRALTGAELLAARARYAADREAERLRQCYPDPTRRHLMEMRLLILEQRHADGLNRRARGQRAAPGRGAAVDGGGKEGGRRG